MHPFLRLLSIQQTRLVLDDPNSRMITLVMSDPDVASAFRKAGEVTSEQDSYMLRLTVVGTPDSPAALQFGPMEIHIQHPTNLRITPETATRITLAVIDTASKCQPIRTSLPLPPTLPTQQQQQQQQQQHPGTGAEPGKCYHWHSTGPLCRPTAHPQQRHGCSHHNHQRPCPSLLLPPSPRQHSAHLLCQRQQPRPCAALHPAQLH